MWLKLICNPKHRVNKAAPESHFLRKTSIIPPSMGAIIAIAHALVMCPTAMMIILYDPKAYAREATNDKRGFAPIAIMKT